MNQQFNPMGGTPNVPSVEELWKNEKSKYRQWIILFALGIVALLVLATIGFILDIVNKEAGIQALIDLTKGTEQLSHSDATRAYIMRTVLTSGVQVLAYVAGVVLFIKTTIVSYQKKNFAFLSQWSTWVVGFSAFFSAISWFWSGFQTELSTATGTYSFAFKITAILVWLLISAPLSRVRRTFMISHKVAELMKSPEYQAFKQQMETGNFQQGPFGPTSAGATTNGATQAPNTQANGNTVKPVTPTVSPQEKKLRALKIDELRKVAKQLSISGVDVMNKEELIKSIMRVSDR